MAKKQLDESPATTPVRVLCDSVYGKPNDVIEIDAAELQNAIDSGQVDASPDAVAFALSIED